MGMFDSIWTKDSKGEDFEIQIKCGLNICAHYEVGDRIPIANGIYYTPEGALVVFAGILVAAFPLEEDTKHRRLFIFDKWNVALGYPELSR